MAKNCSKPHSKPKFILPDELPATVEECHTLIRDMMDYFENTGHKERRRNRDKFGPRSAQTPADNLTGPGKELYNRTKQAIKEEKTSRGIIEESENKHAGGGRKAPDAAKEEETQKHELTGDDLLCPCCKVAREPAGFRVSTQLERIPARFKRIRHVEYKYSCRNCNSEMITALKPYQPIDKGYPGPGLLAHVITSKMAHHLPLYRQEQIFHNLGIPLKRSVLSRWLKQSAEEFELLYDLMREKAMEGRIIFNDETSMPFILKGLGKTKTGSIWYFGGDDQHPYNIYEFAETGSGDTVEKFLAGFFGVVLTDGTNKLDDFFKVKDKDGKQAISARCWAHVYRYFEDAKHAEEAEADYALGLIKSLFHIDSFAFTLPEEECLALRQRLSKPIVEEFKTWLDAQNESAAPTSLLRAVKYTLGQWNGLVQFLNYGFVKLHNNDSENALRAVVLGRRNWLFAGSASGGKASAILMTLVQTCRRLRIDPEEYLEDVLRRMPGCTKKELEQFLPDRWKALKDAASTSNNPTEQTRCA